MRSKKAERQEKKRGPGRPRRTVATKRIVLDFTEPTLREIDEHLASANMSRQLWIRLACLRQLALERRRGGVL